MQVWITFAVVTAVVWVPCLVFAVAPHPAIPPPPLSAKPCLAQRRPASGPSRRAGPGDVPVARKRAADWRRARRRRQGVAAWTLAAAVAVACLVAPRRTARLRGACAAAAAALLGKGKVLAVSR